jgi:hypothetical protein
MEKKHKGGGTKTWSTKRLNALIQEIIDWQLTNTSRFGILAFFECNKDKHNYSDTNFYHRLKQYGDEETDRLMKELDELMKNRMIEKALSQEWSSNMAKFLLNCKYDYVPKTQQTIDLHGDNIKFSFGDASDPAQPEE